MSWPWPWLIVPTRRVMFPPRSNRRVASSIEGLLHVRRYWRFPGHGGGFGFSLATTGFESGTVDHGQPIIQVSLKLTAVIGEHQSGLERHRLRWNRILAAQVGRVTAEFAGSIIDQGFNDICGLGSAGAPIR